MMTSMQPSLRCDTGSHIFGATLSAETEANEPIEQKFQGDKVDQER